MVEQAIKAIGTLVSEHKTLLNDLEKLHSAWKAYQGYQNQLGQDKAAEWRAEQAKQQSERDVTQTRAELETLEKLVNINDSGTILEQLQHFKKRFDAIPAEKQGHNEKRAVTENQLDTHRTNHEQTIKEYEQAQKRCERLYQNLLIHLDAYPIDMLSEIYQQIATKGQAEIAQNVLAEPFESEESASLRQRDRLNKRQTDSQNDLFIIFSEVNNRLHAYAPYADEQGIFRFSNAERANASQLRARLGEELAHQEHLLEAREHELFQNFLLEELANTIGRHITEAEAWVERMNAVLSQSTFVGMHYTLKWKARDPEDKQTGSSLANYHDLLRRQAQTFKQDEINALVHAFRQEINRLRNQTQQLSEASFADALAAIFDYRQWFQFHIIITKPDGTSQVLNNKFFKRGSGAEQYVALYIPFFAALSALYESAGQGAPRLIALDEAFDKVSLSNVKALLKFLADQQFQWIMGGPRVTGEGTQVPVSVKYTMICQPEQELAAGFASFWCSDLSLMEEQ
jgi:hypothetical protein